MQLPPVLKKRLDGLRSRRIAELMEPQGALHSDAVRLFSNDYLSLSNHPRIADALLAAIRAATDSLWMSAVFFGEDSLQRRLERRFAAYLSAGDCMLSQSGYCANIGLLQAIAGPGTNVYIDECAHASLWHGVLASRATPHRFAHNDPSALEELLEKSGPGVVIVDTVYSHDGSVCPLVDVVDLGARYDCVLVVDESHSLGTHGPRGAGIVAELGLEERVHFRTASLAKAFVTRAGLIAGTEAACWTLRYSAGPAIFSSACMAHDLAGLQAAFDLIEVAGERRRRLHQSAKVLRDRISALGYHVASSSQIIGLVSGIEPETIRFRQLLEQRGIYGSVFCTPATRPDESLIRLSLNAALTEDELERVVEACGVARSVASVENWPSPRRRKRDSSAGRTVHPAHSDAGVTRVWAAGGA
jgi:CAI-1 autoinducer synthase